jgi:imidazolonepropionase-like amidohydrolase
MGGECGGVGVDSSLSSFGEDVMTKFTNAMRVVVAVGGLVGVEVAQGQDLGHKAGPQGGPVVIVNASVHPVTAGKPDETFAGFVVFERGVITEMGAGAPAAGLLSGLANATVIDAKGLHVYPGLVGANTQLGLSEIQAVRQTNDLTESGTVAPEVRPSVAVNPDSTLLPVTRSNGILTVGTAPGGGLIPGQVSVIQLDGWTTDDMALRPSSGIVLNWPAMRAVEAWWTRRPLDEQERDIKKNLEDIERVFDTAKAYALAKAADANAATDLRWEAMRPLFETDAAKKVPVYVNANDFDQINAAAAFCQERDLSLVIVGGRDAWLAAKVLKEVKASVVVTTTFGFPRRSDSDYSEAFAVPAKLLEAGVKFCIATSDDTAHERNLPYQAAIAAAHGLPPAEALKAITISAAEILGVGEKIGSLEKGKMATVILTDGNPLEVTTKTRRAWIGGREIDLTNKQVKLYEKYRAKYEQMGQIRKGS